MSRTLEEMQSLAAAAIDRASNDLRDLSLDIHAHPELNFEEHRAHETLTTYLEKQGFRVQRGAYEMATAFEAVAGSGSPTIAVLSEYDALPGIGHACGHNLIAISGVAAAMALKESLGEGNGTVVLLGSPAEEGGGGKVYMVERGAFEGIDAAMMLHPSPLNAAWFQANAIMQVDVEFFGKNAHAAAGPWEGLNALDAMISAFTNISLLRQEMRPTDRVHGVITHGGLKPNIIPEYTRAEFYIRGFNMLQLDELKAKVIPCFEGAAMASRCEVKLSWPNKPYMDVLVNDKIAERYVEHFRALGGRIPGKSEALGGASTDMGNVSYTVPSIHPLFGIPVTNGAGNHTPGFTACAATPEAHENTFRASKAMAFAALDLFANPDLLQAAKDEFAAAKSR